jgi:hypothetical protein
MWHLVETFFMRKGQLLTSKIGFHDKFENGKGQKEGAN